MLYPRHPHIKVKPANASYPANKAIELSYLSAEGEQLLFRNEINALNLYEKAEHVREEAQ